MIVIIYYTSHKNQQRYRYSQHCVFNSLVFVLIREISLKSFSDLKNLNGYKKPVVVMVLYSNTIFVLSRRYITFTCYTLCDDTLARYVVKTSRVSDAYGCHVVLAGDSENNRSRKKKKSS